MKKLILVSALAVALVVSCKKGDTGGDATLVAHIAHHTTPIKGATLYIKFDAKELPSNPTTDYDLKIIGESTENHIHVEGLRYGNYYLYAEGYDSTIMAPVKGGVGVKIKWSKRKKENDFDVPVTED